MWLGVDRHDSSVPKAIVSPDVKGHVELRQGTQSSPVVVDGADDAVLAAPPSVAQQRTERVGASDEEGGDVERLHLKPLAIRREPGSQLGVTDPACR